MLEGVSAHVISAQHLIQNKLHSGRARDLADVEAIRFALGQSNKNSRP
jgi:hypothetical protein